MIFFRLVSSFFFIGLGAYGGGMAAISLLFHETVTKRQWFTPEELKEAITLSQLTPGPIALNAATLLGFRLSGLPGSVGATAAVILPGILILFGLFLIRNYLKHHSKKLGMSTDKIIYSLRAGVLGLLIHAAWTFGRGSITDLSGVLLFSASMLLLLIFKKMHPVFVLLGAGILGLVIYA